MILLFVRIMSREQILAFLSNLLKKRIITEFFNQKRAKKTSKLQY